MTQPESRSYADLMRMGIAPKFFPLLRFHREPRKPMNRGGPRHIFVSDSGAGDIALIDNHDYSNDGTISAGLNLPDGDFVDAVGNLYVADPIEAVVQEYAHNTKTPSFTYRAGMSDPLNVTVDRRGNIYEADWQGGYINEYAQRHNRVKITCSPGGNVEGAAVDKSGDIFVDWVLNSASGHITEYIGGLRGCHGTELGVTLGLLGGMAIDKNGSLLVCDQTNAVVDIIAPPYAKVTGKLGSGYVGPFHVTINKTNKEAFVTDLGTVTVDVLSYPSGSLIQSLGSANGLSSPAGAVYGANAVY